MTRPASIRIGGTGRGARGQWGMCVACALLLASVLQSAIAVPDSPARVNEYEIKAGFLYNIARFVDWPDCAFTDAQTPLLVSVLGDDPFGSALDALQSREVQGRTVLVKRTRILSEVEGSHVLFICASEVDSLTSILRNLKGPVLTVSDIAGFSKRGGCITFALSGNKVRIEANPEAARRANISISAKLLKLSTIVKDATP